MNEHALEAAAQAMCDRVNGQGDFAENIGQRRSGWLAQARAGVEAYLAASPEATATASAREWAALAGHVRGIATVIRAFPNDKAWGGVDQAEEAAQILDRAATALALTDSGTADTHAGSVREECAAACERIANDSVFVGDTEEGRIRHEGIIAGARNCAIAIRALHPVDSRAQGGEK